MEKQPAKCRDPILGRKSTTPGLGWMRKGVEKEVSLKQTSVGSCNCGAKAENRCWLGAAAASGEDHHHQEEKKVEEEEEEEVEEEEDVKEEAKRLSRRRH